MAEDDGNPCEFKAVCNFSHKVTDETCGYYLVKNIEDCPLHKFAIRIQKHFAEKVKERLQLHIECEYSDNETEDGAFKNGMKWAIREIDQLLQDGGD